MNDHAVTSKNRGCRKAKKSNFNTLKAKVLDFAVSDVNKFTKNSDIISLRDIQPWDQMYEGPAHKAMFSVNA